MSEGRIAESIWAKRGMFRYFAIYTTKHGPIEINFVRSDEVGRKGANTDIYFEAKLFRPEWTHGGENAVRWAAHWHFVAELGYSELGGQDIPKHSDNPESFLELLREDGERLVDRTMAVLDSWAGRET
jgi:hypothetical protein